MASTSKIPLILDGRFFKVISNDNGIVKATCVPCSSAQPKPQNVVVSGNIRPTSNFTTHLKRHHAEAFQEYTQYGKTAEKRPKSTHQSTINFPVLAPNTNEISKTDKLILNFVVETMQSVSIVEETSFRQLLQGLNPNAKVMCSKTLKKRIDQEYETTKNIVRRRLEKPDDVCLTADIWTSHSRSFMGVTAHWLAIENQEIKRRSCVLALSRFMGSHTYDKVAEMLQMIMSQFGINSKVNSIVTDNGSNFVKAFHEFQNDDSIQIYSSTLHTEEEGMYFDEIEADGPTQNVPFPELDATEYYLPRHIRCAAHTLNLISKKEPKLNGDGNGVMANKKTMRSTMAKCSALWNKSSRSVQFSENVVSLTGKALVQPNLTRWNSTYDAIKRLLENKSHLPQICSLAGIRQLNQVELEYLEGYYKAMSPIAWALDKLQSDKDYLYGYLSPTIIKCQTQLQKISNEEQSFASILARELLDELSGRFKSILDYNICAARTEILSTVCIPLFKLRWIPLPQRDRVKNTFMEEAKKYTKAVDHIPAASSISDWDDILEPVENSQPATCQNSSEAETEIECIRFLQDEDQNLKSLIRYPVILKMFLKLNTALPSSAPAERLFSFAGMILRPNRARMLDELFEKICFLKLYVDE